MLLDDGIFIHKKLYAHIKWPILIINVHMLLIANAWKGMAIRISCQQNFILHFCATIPLSNVTIFIDSDGFFFFVSFLMVIYVRAFNGLNRA